jgi:hypothetical protein
VKNLFLSIVVVLCGFLVAFQKYRNDDLQTRMVSIVTIFQTTQAKKSVIPIDKATINAFFEKYPDLNKQQSDVLDLYGTRNYNSIWYDKKGLIALVDLLYSKVNELEDEGVNPNLAYAPIIDRIFNTHNQKKLLQTDTEIMLTNMYVFYVKKVFMGRQ